MKLGHAVRAALPAAGAQGGHDEPTAKTAEKRSNSEPTHNTKLQVELIGIGTNQSTWEKASLTLYIDELSADYCYSGDILPLQQIVLLK